jgi:DNA-binding CsgD family transcriptional regulator
MARWDLRTAALLRDTRRALAVYDGRPAVPWLVPVMRELLEAERSFGYGIERRTDGGPEFSFLHAAGMSPRTLRTAEAWMRSQSSFTATYDPDRPAASQRNRVFTLSAIAQLVPGGLSEVPMARDLWPRIGLTGNDHLRVLLCEGPSLLACVGVFRPEAFGCRQQRILAALAPGLRERLILERQLDSGPRWQAAVVACLEAIGRPAFVLNSRGAILETNAAGRALREGLGRRVPRALSDAALGRPSDLAFRMTALRTAETPAGYLALMEGPEPAAMFEHRVAQAAERWKLTPRLRQVLSLVARGLTNRTIAAMIAVTERTVEAHVSALFDRAGVENRASLVARLLRN